MLKGTFQAEATLSSDKIKPITLAIIELHLSEGISYSVQRCPNDAINWLLVPLGFGV